MDNKQNAKTPRNLSFLACKIDRIAAWTLFFVIIAYALSGYGMTKGIINNQLSHNLHLVWLGAIGLIAFIIHTAWAAHLALRRHQIWNSWTKIALAGFYILMILFFSYLHFFYNGSQEARPEPNIYSTNSSLSNNTNITVTDTNSTPTVFTTETLKQYNGLNGRAAYVAIDGVVYDMTKVFRNGKHHGYSAGQDLSTAFYSEHPASYLQGYTIVGTYTEK